MGYRRQMSLQVPRIQGLSPGGWFGCLSWSGKCRINDVNGILHRSEMKTFVTPLRRLIGRLRNAIEGGYGLDGVFEW